MRWFATSVIVLLVIATTPAFADDRAAAARSVALKVAAALFVDHDIAAAKGHIAADAERKGGGAGSMLTGLERAPKDDFATAVLRQVKFFNAADVDALSREHPDDMWTRLAAKLEGGLGVLIVLNAAEEEAEEAKAAGKPAFGLIAMVIKEVEGRPQVVYSDDN